jgi:hypothetical protein
MSKKKYKKNIQFWEQFKDTIIDKGARENIKKLKQSYSKHRKKGLKNEKKNM